MSPIGRSALAAVLLSVAGLSTGCSDERVDVRGIVTIGARPIAGAKVSFHDPRSRDLAGIANTDDAGAFEVEGGLLPGNYDVAVYSAGEVVFDPAADPTLGVPESVDLLPSSDPIVPERFASPYTSGLRAEIAGGTPNRVEFELD